MICGPSQPASPGSKLGVRRFCFLTAASRQCEDLLSQRHTYLTDRRHGFLCINQFIISHAADVEVTPEAQIIREAPTTKALTKLWMRSLMASNCVSDASFQTKCHS